MKLVLRQGVFLASAGVIFGIVLAYAAGKTMEALLAGVGPADPATLFSAIALCVIMTVAGSLLPASRAVRINPTTALRSE